MFSLTVVSIRGLMLVLYAPIYTNVHVSAGRTCVCFFRGVSLVHQSDLKHTSVTFAFACVPVTTTSLPSWLSSIWMLIRCETRNCDKGATINSWCILIMIQNTLNFLTTISWISCVLAEFEEFCTKPDTSLMCLHSYFLLLQKSASQRTFQPNTNTVGFTQVRTDVLISVVPMFDRQSVRSESEIGNIVCVFCFFYRWSP